MIAPRIWVLSLFILSLALFNWPLGFPQAPSVAPQDGSIQTPMRLCPLHDFSNKCGPTFPDAKCGPLVQDGIGVTVGKLIQGSDADDNFYGITPGGGTHNWGTIFKITPAGESTVLYNFGDAGPLDGRTPSGGLTLGTGGLLYGTTFSGGKFNMGIIFSIPSAGGPINLVYTFRGGIQDPTPKGQPAPPPFTQSELDDIAAGNPIGPPVLVNGILYGVTPTVDPWGTGVLYRLGSDHSLKCLHRFRTEEKSEYGLYPANMTLGRDGKFYGTTWLGGLDWGTIFQFDPQSTSGSGGGVTTLYKINNGPGHADGNQPNPLIQGADNNLYGTTRNGGETYRGVVFCLNTHGQQPQYKVLHAFGGNASNPIAGVVEMDVSGILASYPFTLPFLYGASEMNGSVVTRGPSGIIFRVRTDGSDYSVVYNFDGASGTYPAVTPVLARDSNLYAIAEGGGKLSGGEFYRLNTAYVVTGQRDDYKKPASDPTCHQQKVIFEGNKDGKSYIYDNGPVQVVTHMAGYQPDAKPESKALTSDGITVRVKDGTNATTKIVQFFYRQRFDAQNHAIEGWSQQYDPAISYHKGDGVVYDDEWWTSLTDDNKNAPPNPMLACSKKPCGNTFWTSATLDGTTYLNGCTDPVPGPGCTLLSDAAHIRWYVDGQSRKDNDLCQPSNDPIYLWRDTEIDCDGVTLFDSPTLISNAGNETQIFKAMDFIIQNGKVAFTVTWTITKKGSAALEYSAPVITGPPAPSVLKEFSELMTSQKFGAAF